MVLTHKDRLLRFGAELIFAICEAKEVEVVILNQGEDPSLPNPSQMSLRRDLNAIKHTDFPWMKEVTKCAPQMTIIQLGEAFKNFFAGRTQYPTSRKKGVNDRFSITNNQFTVKKNGPTIQSGIYTMPQTNKKRGFHGKKK